MWSMTSARSGIILFEKGGRNGRDLLVPPRGFAAGRQRFPEGAACERTLRPPYSGISAGYGSRSLTPKGRPMSPDGEKPLVLLYNPKVALPGYQRLPHSLLQLGTLLEGRYPYAIIDGNLDQERDRAAEIIEQVRRDGVRY